MSSQPARPADQEGGRQTADELRAALSELRAFVQKTGRLQTRGTVEEVLETGDELLLEAIDFVFCRVYLSATLECAHGLPGREERGLRLVREACPEDLVVDWDVVCWALESGEASLLPGGGSDADQRRLLVVPLVGRTLRLGAVILWVDFDEAGFTENAAEMLRVYARELATALEGLELVEQRARARAFVQHVLDSVPLGIFSVDRSGVLTSFNGTAEFMFGFTGKELVGREYAGALGEEAGSLVRRIVGRLERGEDPGEEELQCGGPGATHPVLGISGSGLSLPGGADPAGYVFVVRDLEVTREVTRLRELDAMKDDLLSLVSHELRTPLASIMAYAEALLMEGMVDTEEERREYLEVIRGEGERLGRLINDVLDLTKMQAGKMDYRFVEQDLNEVVRHGVSVQAALAEKKGIEIDSRMAPDLPPVRMDRDRIVQVICNVLSNAIKYSEEGSRITVNTGRASVEPGQPQCLEVRIADTGAGIPPEQIHKVWSRFEQVESTRHHTGGTGLGMPICRQIVEEGHGGKIWLTSEVGVGTTVYFNLPI